MCMSLPLDPQPKEQLCLCNDGFCREGILCVPRSEAPKRSDKPQYLCGPHSTANPKYHPDEDNNLCLCDPGYSVYQGNCIPEASVAVFEKKTTKECGPNAYWDEVETHHWCDISEGKPVTVYVNDFTAGCFCLPGLCRNSSGCFGGLFGYQPRGLTLAL